MRYEPVIGLEIHVQLKTKSKMFCGCSNNPDNYKPNSTVCPVCMGHPGVLPVTNDQAIRFAVMLAQSLGCKVHRESKFDRKHYFYPDLSKGYQISQYDEPLASGGKVEYTAEGVLRAVRIERLHVEEDAAKMIHASGENASLVDFNRAGTPLVEIVTKPDFTSPQDARAFLQDLRLIVRTLGISQGDMEKGHMRCDANISLRPSEDTFEELKKEFSHFEHKRRVLWPKTEIKNMNSFRSVELALTSEMKRQEKLWEDGRPPMVSSTRGFNDATGETAEQRTKETSEDYRYLPEPDLPRMVLTDKWMESLVAKLPELPQEKRIRLQKEYNLEPQYIEVFLEDVAAMNFFEEVASEMNAWELASDTKHEVTVEERLTLTRLASAWIVTKLFEVLRETGTTILTMKVTAENFAELLYILYKQMITSTSTQEVIKEMVIRGGDPSHIITDQGLTQVSDEDELRRLVESIIATHPQQVKQYKSGKLAVLQFLIGKVMKQTNGRANPEIVKKIFTVMLR